MRIFPGEAASGVTLPVCRMVSSSAGPPLLCPPCEGSPQVCGRHTHNGTPVNGMKCCSPWWLSSEWPAEHILPAFHLLCSSSGDRRGFSESPKERLGTAAACLSFLFFFFSSANEHQGAFAPEGRLMFPSDVWFKLAWYILIIALRTFSATALIKNTDIILI